MPHDARILLLTTDPVPLAETPATGAGMRAWGLAEGLRSAGFANVTIGFAADAVRGRSPELPTGVRTFERAQIDDFIQSHSPDVLLFQHWGLFESVQRELPCPVGIDLTGPHLLERRLWKSPHPERDFQQKLAALQRADFVTCSGKFQRHYFIPFLIQAGHEPTPDLCPAIPFSLSPDLPAPRDDRDLNRFVFSGMFLPWQNPEAPLRALLEAFDEQRRGSLLFIGGPHPSGDVSAGRFDSLLEFLQSHPRVEFKRPMPFGELTQEFQRCGAAIDLMPANAERELAFPTRTVTFLWSGLGVIHNDYDELSEPLRQSGAGWTPAAEDTDAVKQLAARLLDNTGEVAARSDAARRLVQERYTWDKTIAPLAAWCADPVKRRRSPAVFFPGDRPANSDPQGRILWSPKRHASSMENAPWYLSPIVFVMALPVSLALILLFGLAEIVRMALGPRRR